MAIIDVFCHALPPAFVTAVRELNTGPKTMFERATAMPMVDLNARFRVMDLFEDIGRLRLFCCRESRRPDAARQKNGAMPKWPNGNHPDRFVGHVRRSPCRISTRQKKSMWLSLRRDSASKHGRLLNSGVFETMNSVLSGYTQFEAGAVPPNHFQI